MTPKLPPHPATEPCPGGCTDIDLINRRLDDGDGRMHRIEELIKTNTSDTTEVLEILKLGKSFFKMVGYFGAFVRWVAPIGAAIWSVYQLLKNGGKA